MASYKRSEKVLKLFHAVRYDWRVLGETAWRIELREASRRGFKGWFKGISVLKREVLGWGVDPPPVPMF